MGRGEGKGKSKAENREMGKCVIEIWKGKCYYYYIVLGLMSGLLLLYFVKGNKYDHHSRK